MLSIREIQEKTVTYFHGKGVANPKLDTDLLIAHVLEVERLKLYLDLDRPLTDSQLDQLRPLVKRRAEREPLQYILGYTEFCGLSLKVDKRALIPRYETEELVELIVERLEKPPKNILDLGTGSGALAIALAMKFPQAAVIAVDASTEALALAKENSRQHVVENRIQIKVGSWFAALDPSEAFDLIVSNPPYLNDSEMQTAEPEVLEHEPNAALHSGVDGLNDLRVIVRDAPAYLSKGGLLAMETGIEQHAELDDLTEAAGLIGEGIQDLSGRPRFYFARPRV